MVEGGVGNPEASSAAATKKFLIPAAGSGDGLTILYACLS
jgi:hypothetical protein